MTKARDIADGTRYVDVTGDTMTGRLTVSLGGADGLILAEDTNDSVVSNRLILQTASDAGGVYYSDTLGWTFHTGTVPGSTSGTQRFFIDPNGRVRMPYQPCFYASADGTELSAGFSPNSQMTYSTVITNVGGHYSNSRFTAPVAGNYFFSASISPGNASATNIWVGMKMRRNGASIAAEDFSLGHVAVVSGNNQYDCIVRNTVLTLAAGDYVDVIVPYNTFNGNVGFGHFCGYLLG